MMEVARRREFLICGMTPARRPLETHTYGPPGKSRQAPPAARRVSVQGRRRNDSVRRQGALAAQPRALLFPRIALAGRQDGFAGARNRRPRLHRRGQRDARRWRSKTTSSSSTSRNSTSCCATTRHILTSATRRSRNIRASTSRGGSTKTARFISGRIFPHSLAYRIVHFIHKHFLRALLHRGPDAHASAALPAILHSPLPGPCVAGLVTDERYAEAARDVRTVSRRPPQRSRSTASKSAWQRPPSSERYEQAAGYRDLLRTLAEIEERQKIAAAAGDDTDVLAWYAEPPQVAVNLVSHSRRARGGPARFLLGGSRGIRARRISAFAAEAALSRRRLSAARHSRAHGFRGSRTAAKKFFERSAPAPIAWKSCMPQRGQKHAFLELVEKNARHSFEQRFRVLKPSSKAIAEALRIRAGSAGTAQAHRSFDISHMQGSDTVASMVVWEDGRMKKSDYRKFIIRGEEMAGADKDAGAARRFRQHARSRRAALPPLAARKEADAQPDPDRRRNRAIACRRGGARKTGNHQPAAWPASPRKKKFCTSSGREDEPIALEHHSPVLHLIQQIRDETHRFAVTFHRQRRSGRRLRTELTGIPGVGERTAQKLLQKFGSVARLKKMSVEEIAAEISRTQAERVFEGLRDAPLRK